MTSTSLMVLRRRIPSLVVNSSPCFSGDASACSDHLVQRYFRNTVGGKLQVTYNATDDLMYYAGVNRGVKAGFNAPLLGAYFGAGR